MKTIFHLLRTIGCTKLVAFALLSLVLSTNFVVADSFSKFGILRANIARYISDQRWLVYFDKKGLPEKTEVVGLDAYGNIFRVRGDLRPGAENLLSFASYDGPSVEFSTKEGYFYHWNPVGGADPFEVFMSLKDYEKIMTKFELYPLLELSNDGPLTFELLKDNPDFYDRAVGLPRPRSNFDLGDPGAKRLVFGMFFAGLPNNSGCLVAKVVDNYAAAAAGIKENDRIHKLAVNGKTVEMEKFFPLPDDRTIRILSLRVMRKSDDGHISLLDINVFPPTPLEALLGHEAH